MRCQNPFQSQTVGTESVLSSPSIRYILSDPCLSSVFDYGDVHFVGDAQSQLKPKGWLENLITDNYTDVDAHYLLDGVCYGFKMVDPQAIVPEYECTNYRSATSQSARPHVDRVFRSELESGKLSITQDGARCVHAVGAIQKKSGKYCLITDCRRPLNSSVNNFMSATSSKFHYVTFDRICELVEPGDYICTIDISAPYRSISIHPSDRQFFGLHWNLDGNDIRMVDNCICFGAKSAPRISQAVVRMVERRGIRCVCYMDDYLILAKSYEECVRHQLYLIATLRELGFYIAWDKVTNPSTTCRYLGVYIDSVSIHLRLPEDKLAKLRKEINYFVGRRRVTLRQLRRLCGVLSHCARLVRGGRLYSQNIIKILKLFGGENKRITLPREFYHDLAWWSDFAPIFNGDVQIIKSCDWLCDTAYTDASLAGYGAWHCNSGDWLAGPFTKSCAPVPLYTDVNSRAEHDHVVAIQIPQEHMSNINVLECAAVLAAVRRWAPCWANTCVRLHTDNNQVLFMLNKGRSINTYCMTMLKEIFWHSAIFNFHIRAHYIPSAENRCADTLSRWDYRDSQILNLFSLCCRTSDGIG